MPGNPDVATIQGLECLFKNVLQVIVSAAGIVFLVMFTYGGFQYLVSSNDQKKVAQANSTLTLAFFGLVGVIISWLVLRFIQQFTGVNVTDFKIPGP
jgi:TRAP-type C4-dicarboxylate transport system permease small subunit